ncbi:unnamed protein product, partial [Brenthis ino]
MQNDSSIASNILLAVSHAYVTSTGYCPRHSGVSQTVGNTRVKLVAAHSWCEYKQARRRNETAALGATLSHERLDIFLVSLDSTHVVAPPRRPAINTRFYSALRNITGC